MSTNDLPKVHVHINKDPCKHCKCNFQEEDKRLTTWKTWMDIRKETQKRITMQTGRESGDMLMNSSENEHEKHENRLIIQYTKVVDKTDKYRDCPGFFDLPPSLFEKYWKRSPTYFSVKTKEQLCIIPDMEYIRIPGVIMEEKGIKPARNKCKLTFLKSKYLQQRRKNLEDRLLEIEPHKPTGDFTILGTAIQTKHDYNFHLDDRCFSPQSIIDNATAHLERVLPILKINGETVNNKFTGCKEININIDYDVSSNEVRQDLLSITNYSSKALRCSWSKITVCNHFEEYNMVIPVKQQAFFFNLNKFVVIPQQTTHVPIYFKSQSEGMYKELWQLIIEPNLWRPNKIKFQVKLTCVATIQKFDFISGNIKENLLNRVRDRIIDESLRKILATVPKEKADYIVYRYDKPTLFEAINSSFSPINLRPKYIYNKSVVNELEAFYDSIKLDHNPDVWNLNLNTLRQITKEREIHDKELQLQEQFRLLQEKIIKAEAIKSAREALRQKILADINANAKATSKSASKPRKGGKKSPKSPKKSAKSKSSKKASSKKGGKALKTTSEKAEIVVPLIKRQDIPITLSQQLEDIVKKLHQPITWANEQQQRLNIAYALFCAYFDKILKDIVTLNVEFNTEHFTIYPKLPNFIPPLSLRMISEYHDDTMMQVAKFHDTCGTINDKRAEPWVDEIPFEDYEKRYRAFHCIEEDVKNTISKKGGKAKKGSKKDSKKGSKKDKTSKKSKKSKKTAAKSDKTVSKLKEEPHPHLTVIQYDPYAEVTIKPQRCKSPSAISTVTSAEAYVVPEVNKSDKELYRNYLYIIFYDNLCQAIDDLEALLILKSKPTPQHNIIQKVTEGYMIQTENTPETVKVVDLRRVISESLDSKDAVLATERCSRPCYQPLVRPESPRLSMVRGGTKSDSSLWDILQRPKIPVKRLQSGEYTVQRSLSRVDTREASTSVTYLDAEFKVLEYQDTSAQVETWELPRNVDCDIYCPCNEDTPEEPCKPTLSNLRLKVQEAKECTYPQLIIDGTQNFKFYEDSDEGEEENKEKID